MKTKYEINGKIEKEVKEIREVQELVGLKRKNTFGASTVEELEDKFTDMSLVDLQRMAVTSGIGGSGNRAVLKEKIKREFIKFKKGHEGFANQRTEVTKLKGRDKKIREQNVHDLITEGF